MERINRGNYLRQVYSCLGKGEAVVLTGEDTCEREFGNLKQIRDNYP